MDLDGFRMANDGVYMCLPPSLWYRLGVDLAETWLRADAIFGCFTLAGGWFACNQLEPLLQLVRKGLALGFESQKGLSSWPRGF